MTKNTNEKEKARDLAEIVAAVLEEKKGIDVSLMEVGNQTVLADYFVICTGTSNTHVKALAEEVEFKANEKLGIKPNRVEGFSDNTWTLMDYGTVVAHIFTKDGREFYKLEKLWKDASADIITK